MQDDREEFLRDREARLSALSTQNPVEKIARNFFNATIPIKYSYNFDWLGVPIIQYPQDMIALQELIWTVKPELIIETGVARGGSLIFYASMLKLLGGRGKVVGVDIDIRPHNRQSIESHPLSDNIVLIQGGSTDSAVAAEVEKHVKASNRTMVVLDSNHTKEHVAEELKIYSRFVGSGSYLVVMDTVVEFMDPEAFKDRPWGKGDSPFNAVEDFLTTTDRFVVDSAIDAKLLISVAPSGYLRCIKDPA